MSEPPATMPATMFDRRWQKRLSSSAAGEAWREFLYRYSGLLLSVIQRHQHGEQAVNDAFLFVCERLVDNGFRRLRQWKPRTDASFDTWLRAVTANLCVDFARHSEGRFRPPRSVQKLGRLEQRVYECRFGQRLKISECLRVLLGEFPDLTEVRLAGIIGELNHTLDSRQHWSLRVRQQGFVSLDDSRVGHHVTQTADDAQLPEQRVHAQQQSEQLQSALARLSPQQRLLLRLRYEKDLPLRGVAQAAGLKDAYQARYLINKALEQLALILNG